MSLITIQDIERAIDALPPHELAELYAWLDGTARRMQRNRARRFLNKGLAYSAVRTMPH